MEKCKFESGKCSVECKKYSMCMYKSLQNQLSNFQEQFTFIYTALKDLLENNNKVQDEITALDKKLELFTTELLDLYNYSEKTGELTDEKEY